MEEHMTMHPATQNRQLVSNTASSRSVSRLSAFAAASIALVLTLGVSNALAKGPDGGYTHGGGYTGPGPALSTVEQAKNMRDDSHVTLRGHIVQHLGGERYVFKDNTGTINVEIDNKRWQGQTVGPNDLVEISGELDKEWRELEIDVKKIVKQ